MLSPPSGLARAPRSSHQLATWRSAAALTDAAADAGRALTPHTDAADRRRTRRPRLQSAHAATRLPPERPAASCGAPTPRRPPTDEPVRGRTRPAGRHAPPGMFCTPRAYSASSLLTAQRVGQRELAARAAAAEAAEAAEEKARWPQHLLS